MNKSRRQQRRNQRRNQRSNRNRNQQRGGADAFVKDEAVLVGEKEATITTVIGNDMYEVTYADSTKETKPASEIKKKGGLMDAVSNTFTGAMSGLSGMISGSDTPTPTETAPAGEADKAEADRLAAEKAEADRLAAEKAEADRLAAEKAAMAAEKAAMAAATTATTDVKMGGRSKKRNHKNKKRRSLQKKRK